VCLLTCLLSVCLLTCFFFCVFINLFIVGVFINFFIVSVRLFHCGYLSIYRQPPQASIHNLHHSAIYIDIDEVKKLVLTVGKDKVIKVDY